MLVVDDVPTNIELLQIHLDRGCHQVTVARDGESAVAAYEAGRFDVVLMDLQMPEMDGIEATREIRALSGIGQPYIVAFSADVQAGKKLEFGPHAFNAFLGKPLRMQQLGECLEQIGTAS